jgi:MFS family permease
MSVLGLGIVTGSLILAHRARSGLPAILLCTSALAAAQLAVAAVHSLPAMLAAIFAYGLCTGLFSVAVVSTLQSQTLEDMRGRVMAVYSICFNGCSLFGAPAFAALAGWIGVSAALRATAGICAAVALITALAWQMKGRVRVRPPTTPSSAPPPSCPVPSRRHG